MEYNYYVAGTSYREANLERMLSRNPDFDAPKSYILDHYGEGDYVYRYHRYYTSDIKFTPEPTNPHDPNAIRIDVDGNFVGYVKRGSTGRIRNLLNTPGVSVRAEVYGGPYRYVYVDDNGNANAMYSDSPFGCMYTFTVPGGGSQRQSASTSGGRAAKFCRHCGEPIEASAKFCTSCGQPLPTAPAAKYCRNCGRQLDVKADYCPFCGGTVGSNRGYYRPTYMAASNQTAPSIIQHMYRSVRSESTNGLHLSSAFFSEVSVSTDSMREKSAPASSGSSPLAYSVSAG